MNRTLDDWRAMPETERSDARRESRRSADIARSTHNAFIFVDAEDEPGAATGVLGGIPIAVKDNIEVEGQPTSGGTDFLAEIPDADADVVSALVTAGASVVGKTNLHELAFGITSNNGAHGPVRNPVDPARVAGGSSGGSAVAVALDIVPLSVGTDTGASISVPAAFCGVAGFRPSTGRYPSDGIIHLSWTRDTAGLHANTVADLRLGDALITGESAGKRERATDDIRLGIPDAYLRDLHPEVEAQFRKTTRALESEGIEIVPIDLPGHFETTAEHDMVVVGWEAPRAVLAYLASARGDAPTDLGALAARTASSDVRDILHSLNDDPVPGFAYRRAREARWRLRRAFVAALDAEGVDAVIFPTTPVLPPLIGEDDTLELNGTPRSVFGTVVRHTAPGTFMGVPMVTIPTAAREALPVGMTVMGRPFNDVHVLRVADRTSEVVDLHVRRP